LRPHRHPTISGTTRPPTTTVFSQVPEMNTGLSQEPTLMLSLSAFSLLSLSLKKKELDGNHLVWSANLLCNNKTISVPTLIDAGTTGFTFMDETFVRHHNLTLYPLKTPQNLEEMNSRPIQSGAITIVVYLELEINRHVEKSPFFVTQLRHYLIILRIP
jgi:hypothetical protein